VVIELTVAGVLLTRCCWMIWVNAGRHHRVVPPVSDGHGSSYESFSDKTPATSRACRVGSIGSRLPRERCRFQRRLVRKHGDQDAAAPALLRLSSRPTLTALMQAAGVVSLSRKVAG
jgi:hypothetical protein